MVQAASNTNRRKESRYRTLTGQRMSWSGQMSVGASRKGWVLDVSRSGMAMMVERQALPALGDVIGVQVRPAADPVSYKVVRVQNGAQKIVVVGCEKIYGKTADLDLPEPAWARSAAA